METISENILSQKKMVHLFPWIKTIKNRFLKSFPADYDLDALVLFHGEIEKEVETISIHTSKRNEALFAILVSFYNHFCWKIKWKEPSPHMKVSCTKLLSSLSKVGLELSNGNLDSKWLGQVLSAIKVFPGDCDLLYDALFNINKLKRDIQTAYGVILKHILSSSPQYPEEPTTYFKLMFLYRRLKLISNARERTGVVSLAARVPVPPGTPQWLTAHGVEELCEVKRKDMGRLLMKKAVGKDVLAKLRSILLPDDTVIKVECEASGYDSSDQFFIDKDRNVLNGTNVESAEDIENLKRSPNKKSKTKKQSASGRSVNQKSSSLECEKRSKSKRKSSIDPYELPGIKDSVKKKKIDLGRKSIKNKSKKFASESTSSSKQTQVEQEEILNETAESQPEVIDFADSCDEDQLKNRPALSSNLTDDKSKSSKKLKKRKKAKVRAVLQEDNNEDLNQVINGSMPDFTSQIINVESNLSKKKKKSRIQCETFLRQNIDETSHNETIMEPIVASQSEFASDMAVVENSLSKKKKSNSLFENSEYQSSINIEIVKNEDLEESCFHIDTTPATNKLSKKKLKKQKAGDKIPCNKNDENIDISIDLQRPKRKAKLETKVNIVTLPIQDTSEGVFESKVSANECSSLKKRNKRKRLLTNEDSVVESIIEVSDISCSVDGETDPPVQKKNRKKKKSTAAVLLDSPLNNDTACIKKEYLSDEPLSSNKSSKVNAMYGANAVPVISCSFTEVKVENSVEHSINVLNAVEKIVTSNSEIVNEAKYVSELKHSEDIDTISELDIVESNSVAAVLEASAEGSIVKSDEPIIGPDTEVLELSESNIKEPITPNKMQPTIELVIMEPIVESNTAKPVVESDTVELTIEKDTANQNMESDTTETTVEADITKPIVELDIREHIVKSDPTETIVESSTAEPIVELSTEEPIVESSTAEPIVELSTEEPIVESSTAEPIVESSTAEPIVESSTAEPIVESSTAEPRKESEVAEPFMKTGLEKPTMKSNTAEPTMENNTAEPILKSYTKEPTVEPNTEEPTMETNTAEPTVEPNTKEPKEAEPIVKTDLEEPIVELDTEEPLVEPNTAEHIIKCDVVESIDQSDVVQTIIESNKLASTVESDTIEPVIQSDTIEPEIESNTLEPINKSDILKLVSKSDVIEPIIELHTEEPSVQINTVVSGLETTAESGIARSVIESESTHPTAKLSTVTMSDTLNIIAELYAVENIVESDMVEPIVELDTAQPIRESDTDKSIKKPEVINIIVESNTEASIVESIIAQPIDESDTGKLIKQSDTIEIMDESDRIEPILKSYATSPNAQLHILSPMLESKVGSNMESNIKPIVELGAKDSNDETEIYITVESDTEGSSVDSDVVECSKNLKNKNIAENTQDLVIEINKHEEEKSVVWNYECTSQVTNAIIEESNESKLIENASNKAQESDKMNDPENKNKSIEKYSPEMECSSCELQEASIIKDITDDCEAQVDCHKENSNMDITDNQSILTSLSSIASDNNESLSNGISVAEIREFISASKDVSNSESTCDFIVNADNEIAKKNPETVKTATEALYNKDKEEEKSLLNTKKGDSTNTSDSTESDEKKVPPKTLDDIAEALYRRVLKARENSLGNTQDFVPNTTNWDVEEPMVLEDKEKLLPETTNSVTKSASDILTENTVSYVMEKIMKKVEFVNYVPKESNDSFEQNILPKLEAVSGSTPFGFSKEESESLSFVDLKNINILKENECQEDGHSNADSTVDTKDFFPFRSLVVDVPDDMSESNFSEVLSCDKLDDSVCISDESTDEDDGSNPDSSVCTKTDLDETIIAEQSPTKIKIESTEIEDSNTLKGDVTPKVILEPSENLEVIAETIKIEASFSISEGCALQREKLITLAQTLTYPIINLGNRCDEVQGQKDGAPENPNCTISKAMNNKVSQSKCILSNKMGDQIVLDKTSDDPEKQGAVESNENSLGKAKAINFPDDGSEPPLTVRKLRKRNIPSTPERPTTPKRSSPRLRKKLTSQSSEMETSTCLPPRSSKRLKKEINIHLQEEFKDLSLNSPKLKRRNPSTLDEKDSAKEVVSSSGNAESADVGRRTTRSSYKYDSNSQQVPIIDNSEGVNSTSSEQKSKEVSKTRSSSRLVNKFYLNLKDKFGKEPQNKNCVETVDSSDSSSKSSQDKRKVATRSMHSSSKKGASNSNTESNVNSSDEESDVEEHSNNAKENSKVPKRSARASSDASEKEDANSKEEVVRRSTRTSSRKNIITKSTLIPIDKKSDEEVDRSGDADAPKEAGKLSSRSCSVTSEKRSLGSNEDIVPIEEESDEDGRSTISEESLKENSIVEKRKEKPKSKPEGGREYSLRSKRSVIVPGKLNILKKSDDNQ